MPDPLLCAAAQGCAAVAAAALVLAIGWFLRRGNPGGIETAAVVGIAGGLGAGFAVLRISVSWPPLNGLDRFLTIVLPAALFIEFAATLVFAPRWLAWLMRFSLAATMGRILLHNSVYLGGAKPEWSPVQAATVLLAAGGLIALVWASLVRLSARSPAGISLPLALALTLQSTGLAIMLGGYLQGGVAALPLSAATAGTVLSLCLLTNRPDVRAPVGIGVVGLGSLLIIGRFFGGLSTAAALTLLLAPLLCWGTEWPPLRSGPAWRVGAVRLLLVAILLSVVVLQAKVRFDRQTAPLLMPRSRHKAPARALSSSLRHRLAERWLLADGSLGSGPPPERQTTGRSLTNRHLPYPARTFFSSI